MTSKEFWPFLFFTGLLLMNWPFLQIFGKMLPLYFILVWAGFIAAVGLSIFLINKKRTPGN